MNMSDESREAACLLVGQCLNFIAEDHVRLGDFLNSSGIDPTHIRQASEEPTFLSGVLDFLVQRETMLVGFAESQNISPEEVVRAHLVLSGMPVSD